MANNAKVNYDDKRFTEVEEEEKAAVKETTNTYDSMINNTNSYYQDQIDASKEWATKQNELQQEQTDFTIEKIDQAKEQAEKDYTKEQRGAYTDYQKATNQYGANAETLASQGLNQAGYSESTRTNLFNTYQNRYAAARESYNKAILNYDNSIKEAQLANNAALATIAYQALQTELELSLQGFQYKNQLILQKVDAINAEKDRYYQRYQNVLSQINTENSMAEQIRQYNESLKENQRQYNETKKFQESESKRQQKNWEKEYALSQRKASGSGGSSGGGYSGGNTLAGADLPQNDPKKPKEEKATKLSSYGSTILKAARSLYGTVSGSDAQKKQYTADFVAKARYADRINDSDVKLILKQLGIE